jgi:hypothetical protein
MDYETYLFHKVWVRGRVEGHISCVMHRPLRAIGGSFSNSNLGTRMVKNTHEKQVSSCITSSL